MASGTSDRAVIPNQEGDESSMVSDPSIQASLQRTSSILLENIAVGDDVNVGMESSNPVASSKNSEIIEVEDDPSPGMEPSIQATSLMLDLADNKVNPFKKHLSITKYEKDVDLAQHFKELKQNLHDGLQVEAVHEILEHKNMTEAQKRVQELLDLFGAIEYVIYNWRGLLKTPIPKKDWSGVLKTSIPKNDPDRSIFKADYRRTDIYRHLLEHAWSYTTATTELQENPHDGRTPVDSTLRAYLSSSFGAIDFMVFLINKVHLEEGDIMDPSLAFFITKVQEEGDIMDPSLALQMAKTSVTEMTKVTKRVNMFEKETISTVICLVVNGEGRVAKFLFKRLLQLMEPSDIINRARVYNYALQRAQELLKVCTFLHNPSLSQRYKIVVQGIGRLDKLANLDKLYDNQVKVQTFLVTSLYVHDGYLKPNIDWEFVKQHDYPYLIQCLWERYNFRRMPNAVKNYKWTPLQLNYVFTSSAAITGRGQEIMKDILEAFKAWPALINVTYKGVAALHVAVFQGNELAVEYLLEQKELDINVRTGRLLTIDEFKKYELTKPSTSGTKFDLTTDAVKKYDLRKPRTGLTKYKQVPPPYATVVADREELIKDHPDQKDVEVNNSDRPLDVAKKFFQRISEKKWNKNRWDLPTYQTALHIATTKGHAKTVNLLCDTKTNHQQRLRCHEEDEEKLAPLDILYCSLNIFGKDAEFSEIEKILLSKQDVQNGITRMRENRQALVESVNTILVGAALIASVTFAGWLQPPLGYAQDYDLAVPYPAPPDTYNSYLGVQGNFGVKAFALFNSLSFFFGIATVIVGADATFPPPLKNYVGHNIHVMNRLLRLAIKFFVISLVCALGAFGSAAIVVLPPSLLFRKDLVLSIIIGCGVCGFAVWQFLSRHFAKMQWINRFIADRITRINNFANVF